MNIPILYEDESLLVCVKPRGVSSEEDGLGALLAEQAGCARCYCVHRLDQAVGGVMVWAKTKDAAASLSGQISGGGMRKEYLAVVSGQPEASGELFDLLFHDRAKNKTYVVRRKRAGVREASLSYRRLAGAEGLSLVQIRLHTGRSHQVRVQFASRGMPLAGDGKYGSIYKCPLALWAFRLGFRRPADGRALSFTAMPEAEYPWTLFDYEPKGEPLCDTLK